MSGVRVSRPRAPLHRTQDRAEPQPLHHRDAAVPLPVCGEET